MHAREAAQRTNQQLKEIAEQEYKWGVQRLEDQLKKQFNTALNTGKYSMEFQFSKIDYTELAIKEKIDAMIANGYEITFKDKTYPTIATISWEAWKNL